MVKPRVENFGPSLKALPLCLEFPTNSKSLSQPDSSIVPLDYENMMSAVLESLGYNKVIVVMLKSCCV